MPNDKKGEVDNFLSDLGIVDENPLEQSGDNLFQDEPKQEEVEEKTEEKEEIPFHKNSKLQKFIEKEVNRRLEKIPTQPQSSLEETKSSEEDSLTDILTRIIGNDTPEKISAIKDFRKELSLLEEKGAEKALQKLEAEKRAEAEAERQAMAQLESGIESIEEMFNVDLTSNATSAKKSRNEFLDFVKRVSPKDENGNVVSLPDLQETFSLFQQVNKKPTPDSSRARELASKSMGRSLDASSVKQTQGTTWKDVEKLFSNLTR